MVASVVCLLVFVILTGVVAVVFVAYCSQTAKPSQAKAKERLEEQNTSLMQFHACTHLCLVSFIIPLSVGLLNVEGKKRILYEFFSIVLIISPLWWWMYLKVKVCWVNEFLRYLLWISIITTLEIIKKLLDNYINNKL